MKYFSSNLKFLRKSRGLTQAEIQASTGIEMTTWGNYERGKSFPKLELFSEITKYFGVSAEDLLNIDLSNVHLNNNAGIVKNDKNVHPNVHQTVHLKPEKGQKMGESDDQMNILNDQPVGYKSETRIIDALTIAVKGLERANARLEQELADLEEENRRLKSEIPVIGKKVESKKARAS